MRNGIDKGSAWQAPRAGVPQNRLSTSFLAFAAVFATVLLFCGLKMTEGVPIWGYTVVCVFGVVTRFVSSPQRCSKGFRGKKVSW